MTFDYGRSFYVTESLHHFASRILTYLPDDVTHLLTRGSSGNSLAAAVLTLAMDKRTLSHIHVRKEGENAHTGLYCGGNSPFLFPPSEPPPIYAIVDDLIDKGTTVIHLWKFVKEELKVPHLKGLVKYVLLCVRPSEGQMEYVRENTSSALEFIHGA